MTEALQIIERTAEGACPECGCVREWLATDDGFVETECPTCEATITPMPAALPSEGAPATRLAEVEAQLAECIGAFRKVTAELAALLREIRDDRLYLAAGFDTFDAYCLERWELSRRHVDRLVAWDEVAEATKAAGLPAPEKESHARELADLEPELAAEIWKETIAAAEDQGTKITAKAVRSKREELLGKKSPMRKAEDREKSRTALMSSDSNEWYTPAAYTDEVRDLFGGNIDLDPASCAEANEWIEAGTIYTVDQDGLEQQWFGRVFANPPNGKHEANNQSMQGLFAEKAVDSYAAAEVDEVVMFVNAATGAQWFQPLFAWPICFIAGRPKHVRPRDSTGNTDNPTHYRAFVYVGPRIKWPEFEDRFSKFGYVHVPTRAAE